MTIKLNSANSDILKSFSEVSGVLISSSDYDFEITAEKCECGFSVEVQGKTANIKYGTLADFNRASAICIDTLRNGKEISVSQKGAFSELGIMLDCSRGAVIKVSRIKEIMRLIAKMGFNELMLYTEDTYELEDYPYFGYMRGRYSADEIKEVVAYGNMIGIETVPCIQTLGHLHTALKWKAFENVTQSTGVLLPGEEDTYRFIEAMVKKCRECFTTSKIHVGMDEVPTIGTGAYLEKHGERDKFEIMSEHLGEVCRICEKYNFEPMMWSDMFFRLGTANGDYYDEEIKFPENISSLIPNGVSQVYWDYYNHEERIYDTIIKYHKKLECPLIFAGGVWIWGTLNVNYRQTFDSMKPALEACKREGITHVFATMWGDDGCECDVTQSLLGLQYFAEQSYCESVSREGLAHMFKVCTGCDADAFEAFDIDNFGTEYSYPERYDFRYHEFNNIITSSKILLYQNPMYGIFDKNFENVELKEHYQQIYTRLLGAEIPEEFKMVFDCHKQLVKILIGKCDIGIRLKSAYDNHDMKSLEALSDELHNISDDVAKLYELRCEMWHEYNKPFGFEYLRERLSALEASLRHAEKRVSDYCCGKEEALEELEQERLYYQSVEKAFFQAPPYRAICSPW